MKRTIGAVLGLSLVAAACGGADDGDEGSASLPDKLVVWDFKSGDAAFTGYYDQVQEAFEADTGVEVEFVAQPVDQYYTILGTAIESESGPDLVMFNGGAEIKERVDALVPLDEYVGEARDRLVGWDAFSADGAIYGVPLTLQGFPIYYNRALYEQAGLDPDNPPRTWPELESVCSAVEEHTEAPCFALGNQEGWGIDWFLSVLGPGLLTEEQYDAWQAGERDWDSPEIRRVFELWAESGAEGWYNDGVNSTPMFMDSFAIFQRGEAANVVGLISDVAHWKDFEEFLGDDLGVMLPVAAGDGDTFLPVDGGIGHAVTSWAADPELTAELALALANTDALRTFFEQSGAIASDTTIDLSSGDAVTVPDIVSWLADSKPSLHAAVPLATLAELERTGQELIAGDISVDDAVAAVAATDS